MVLAIIFSNRSYKLVWLPYFSDLKSNFLYNKVVLKIDKFGVIGTSTSY